MACDVTESGKRKMLELTLDPEREAPRPIRYLLAFPQDILGSFFFPKCLPSLTSLSTSSISWHFRYLLASVSQFCDVKGLVQTVSAHAINVDCYLQANAFEVDAVDLGQLKKLLIGHDASGKGMHIQCIFISRFNMPIALF